VTDANPGQLQLDLTTRPAGEANARSSPPETDSRLAGDEGQLADQLADRVYERLAMRLHADSPPSSGDLLDAAEVARLLKCERGWVYEHKEELGAVALGAGVRPRLRFPRARVEAIARLEARPGDNRPPGRRRHSPRTARSTAVTLLEVKGRVP
jgi:hypothetical protein